MKRKLLLITTLTATALNVYAEGKLLKHTEQAAPHTTLTLTTLKADPNPILKLMKSHAEHSTAPVEQIINATSKLESIDPTPGADLNQVVIKGNISYMIWNDSQISHTYTIGRNVCITDKTDDNAIANCSYVDDKISIKANEMAYLNSRISSYQILTVGKFYDVAVGLTVKDENNNELFVSSDGHPYEHKKQIDSAITLHNHA